MGIMFVCLSLCQTRALSQNEIIVSHYIKPYEIGTDVVYTALNEMQTRSSDENSVCPSVRLSVKPVTCDKTKEWCVQIFIPYERSLSLVFWKEAWLVGATPSTWNFGSTGPRWSEIMLSEGWRCPPKRCSISKCLSRRRIERCYIHGFRTYIFAKAYTRCSAVCLRSQRLVLTPISVAGDGHLLHETLAEIDPPLQ